MAAFHPGHPLGRSDPIDRHASGDEGCAHIRRRDGLDVPEADLIPSGDGGVEDMRPGFPQAGGLEGHRGRGHARPVALREEGGHRTLPSAGRGNDRLQGLDHRRRLLGLDLVPAVGHDGE